MRYSCLKAVKLAWQWRLVLPAVQKLFYTAYALRLNTYLPGIGLQPYAHLASDWFLGQPISRFPHAILVLLN